MYKRKFLSWFCRKCIMNVANHFRCFGTNIGQNSKDHLPIQCLKVHIFWEGHKILRNIHQLFVVDMYCQSNNWWRFRKILWPSQNIWTLSQETGTLGLAGLYYASTENLADSSWIACNAQWEEIISEVAFVFPCRTLFFKIFLQFYFRLPEAININQ